MKNRRIKKGRTGQPGKQNPVKAMCLRGHEIWINSGRKTARCQICGGKK